MVFFLGILLLGEVLVRLASKPLDDATIHSLIGFFTDRLVSLAFTINTIVLINTNDDTVYIILNRHFTLFERFSCLFFASH